MTVSAMAPQFTFGVGDAFANGGPVPLGPTVPEVGVREARSREGSPARPALRVVQEGEVAPAPARLRITARGRLVCTLVAFGVASLIVLMVWARLTAVALPPEHIVTVEAGQTLSQLAADQLPMLPVERAVVRIQLANSMNGTALVAGQELVIPGS